MWFLYLFYEALLTLPGVIADSKQHVLQSRSSPFHKEFEKLVKENLDFWHVPGISIAVVDGEESWAEVWPSHDVLNSCFCL